MSGCFDQLNCHCNVDLEGKRNAVASVISSVLFFFAWWLMIDTAAVYSKASQFRLNNFCFQGRLDERLLYNYRFKYSSYVYG